MNKFSRRGWYGGGYTLSHKEERRVEDIKSEMFPGLSKLLAGITWGYIAYSADFGGTADVCKKISGNEKQIKNSLSSYSEKSDSLSSQITKYNQSLLKTFKNIEKETDEYVIPDEKYNDLKNYANFIDEIYKDAVTFINSLNGLKQEDIFNYKEEDLKKYCKGLGLVFSILDVSGDEKTNQSPERVLARINNYIEKHKQKKITSSINKEISSMKKNADKVSDNYYKDALMGLSDDSFMKAYYKGFSEEYNKKDEAPKRSYKDLMDVFKEEENIVLKSHPNSVFVADALNEGGLIENGLEQKEKIEKIVRKRPSGNFR